MHTRGSGSKTDAQSEGLTPATARNSAIQRFERKLNEMSASFSEQLKAMEERIMLKFGDLCANVSNLRSDFKKLSERVAVLEKRTEGNDFEFEKIKAAVNVIENDKIANDLMVYNLPNNTDAMSAARKIVDALSIKDIAICSAFRTKSKANNSSQPIIVKLRSSNDRSLFFRALAEFKKVNKRQLRLSDVGFSGDGNIILHECITSSNRELLNNAIRFKKSQLLFAAFTLRGLVYVKKSADGVAFKIADTTSLNNFVGGV